MHRLRPCRGTDLRMGGGGGGGGGYRAWGDDPRHDEPDDKDLHHRHVFRSSWIVLLSRAASPPGIEDSKIKYTICLDQAYRILLLFDTPILHNPWGCNPYK